LKEIENNENLIETCKAEFSTNYNAMGDSEEQLKSLTEKAEKLSKKLLSVTEKISLGEELADANRKKIIQSIESLSDIKLNTGTMSIEKNNLVAKLNELTEKLDQLSVKRDSLFNDKERADNSINELDRAVYDLKNQIEEKENQVRDCNEKVAKSDNAIYSLNSVITTLVTKDNFYRGLKDNYEGYAPSVKLLLNKATKI
jgi:chromosome segregation ATPase